ncbi:methyltransferase family protein [Enterococcus sp. LJL99]
MFFTFFIAGLISLFYIIYFSKQIQLKRKKIATNRLSKGIKPAQTMKNEKKLLFFTYATAAIQYVSLFDFNFLFLLPTNFLIKSLGSLLAIIGIVFFTFAIITMRNNWRAGVDETQKTALTTTGIYKLSRNPAFVGFDLFYLGILLAEPNLILLLFSFLTIFYLHLQIVEEEKYLIKTFGQDYLNYMAKTPRYLVIESRKQH